MGADQPGFSLSQVHVGLCQLGIALPQALDLPPFEGQAGLEAVLDKVIVARAPIDGDRVASRFFGLLLAHRVVAEVLVRERIIRAKRCMARAFV